jgi:beta-galactosidase/beta-glucuronidase
MKKSDLMKHALIIGSIVTASLVPGCNGSKGSSSISSSSISSSSSSSSSSIAYTNYEGNVDSTVRLVKTLSGKGWKFKKVDIPEAKNVDYDDSGWLTVSIPHTWNNADGQDGGGNYMRTASWYRREITLTKEEFEGKKHYLEFFGANMQAEAFVNGESVGLHKGGYTAFRFDVTNQLHEGKNILAVWVSNVKTQDIAPLGADFNFYGGIYREVNLVSVSPVHVDTMNYGSNGLKLTTTNVSEEQATLTMTSTIVNDSEVGKTVEIKATLKEPDSFEAITTIKDPDFDVNNMGSGAIVETVSQVITIPANDKVTFEKVITVDHPRLWNGRIDPFRYEVQLQVIENSNVVDDVTDHVGFRYFEVTKDGGYYLNGVSYPLRGVSRHQEWKNKGNAIGKNEHDVDFGYMYEMGVNAIRLAHYPQSNYMYELCDKYGIVVWAEIPFVNHVGTASSLRRLYNPVR